MAESPSAGQHHRGKQAANNHLRPPELMSRWDAHVLNQAHQRHQRQAWLMIIKIAHFDIF